MLNISDLATKPQNLFYQFNLQSHLNFLFIFLHILVNAKSNWFNLF